VACSSSNDARAPQEIPSVRLATHSTQTFAVAQRRAPLLEPILNLGVQLQRLFEVGGEGVVVGEQPPATGNERAAPPRGPCTRTLGVAVEKARSLVASPDLRQRLDQIRLGRGVPVVQTHSLDRGERGAKDLNRSLRPAERELELS
jgi:hypothetical protein